MKHPMRMILFLMLLSLRKECDELRTNFSNNDAETKLEELRESYVKALDECEAERESQNAVRETEIDGLLLQLETLKNEYKSLATGTLAYFAQKNPDIT